MTWYLLALAAAFVLGIYSIIEKKGLKKTDPLSFLLISSLIISFFSLPILFTHDVFIFSSLEMLLLTLKSLFAALFFLFIAKALSKMEISEFAPFLSFSSVIVLILSYLFLREAIGFVAIIGVLLVVGGAYILELTDGVLSPFQAMKKNKNIHFIFLGLFFGALCAIIDRSILSQGPDLVSFFFFNNILLAAFFGLFSFFRKDNLKQITQNFKPAFFWALLGASFYMIGDFLYFKALTIPTGMVALVIPLKRMSILISTLVGGRVFHESNLFRKFIAALIMLSGVYLIIN